MGARPLFSLELELTHPIGAADLLAAAETIEDAGYTTLAIGGAGTVPDPTTILAAIAARTSQIGVVAVVNVDATQPYDFARRLASLDHLSKGRAGWKPYAKPGEFSADRIAEFVHVVTHLLDSWDDDAPLYDKANGLYVDINKVHRLDHAGRFFTVAGPLDIPRPPQGHPVLIRDVTISGDFGSSWPNADIVETNAQRGLRSPRRGERTAAGGPALISAVGHADDLASLRAKVDDGLIDGVTFRTPPLAAAIERAATELRLSRQPPRATLREALGLPRPASLFDRVVSRDGALA